MESLNLSGPEAFTTPLIYTAGVPSTSTVISFIRKLSGKDLATFKMVSCGDGRSDSNTRESSASLYC